MAYEDDDEEVWEPDDEEVQEEPDVPDDPADEQEDVVDPPEPPAPPPPPEDEEPPAEAAPDGRQRMLYDDSEEAPPLAPDDRTEAPQPVRYAQNLATGTMTDESPEQPAEKKRVLYDDSEDATPASAAAADGGKKRVLYEEPEGAFGTFTRELLHGAPPAVVGAVTGAGTGAALGAAGFNPLTVLGGTIAGGIAGGVTADIAKDKGLKALGHDDNALRAANAKENPWSAAAGTFMSNVFGGAAGLGKAVVTGTARMVGGAIGGGWETGSQIYQGKSLKEAIPPIAAATAGGAVFAGGRPWTRKAEEVGGKFGARFAGAPTAAAPDPAATPPEQGVLPGFGTPGDKPFDVRDPTQEKAQIGGGEAQPELPGLRAEPPAPPKPGVTTQPELGLEPPPTINKEGQYGFSINAPHPDSTHTTPSTGAGTSRNPMPDAAGTAKEATPPPQARQPNTAPIGSPEGPHSAVVRGITAEPPPDAGSGIHVLQPGQLDSTLQHGIKARTASAEPPPRTTFEPPRPPEQGPPAPPSGEIIPRERALVPHRSESTQGVTETPVPGNHTRLYQGENQPPNTFTTNRQAAEAHGPVKSVDVHNEHGMPFFNPTNQPGHFTTKNEIYRQRAQPVEQLATQPVAKPGEQPPGPKPPPGGEPPPPAGIPPGAKLASAELETKLKGMPPEAPTSQPPIGPPGGIAPTTMPPTPGVPTKTAKAIAKSKAADKGPGEAVVGKTPYGVEIKAKYDSKMTLSEALAKHGTAPGLMDKVTKPVRDMVEKLIGNMPVHFMPNSEFRKMGRNNYVGLYHWQGDNISINNKYAAHPGEFARTIIHEAMHGVTSHAIGSVPEVRAAIKQIMFDVKSKHKPAGPTKYGFKNEREFVAEAFSNVAFQKMLADHVLSPKVAAQLKAHFDNHPVKSAWDAVVQTVRKVLGLKPSETSALEAVMKATAHAMAENPAAKAKYMAEQGMGKAQNYQTDGASPPPRGRRPEAEGSSATSGRPTVTARDKFGNEAKFVGDTVHAAAAFAKGAGYKPNQIFNQDGTPYTPPKAAAQTTAQTGATPTQTAVPPGGGAGKPPGGGSPPAGGTPLPKGPSQQPATTLAGARQSILSQVAQKPPWYSKLPTSKEEAKALWREFYTATKNAMDPLEQARKRDTRELTPEEDFAMLARLTKGLGGRFHQIIKNGTYDINTGTKNGKGLDEVIKPIADHPEEFTAYALSKRVIELENRGIKTGMNLPDARRVVAEEGHRFEPVFRDLVEFQGRVLDNMVKTGIISHEAAAKMRALNKEYVPFYRALDPDSELGIQLGSGLQTRNPIFKIKGSDKEVFDPIDSIIKNTYVFTDLAHRNQAMVAMRDFNNNLPADKQFMVRDRSSHPIEVKETELQRWMDKHGIEGFADDTMTIFRPDAFRPADDKIRLYSNGKAEVYTVPKNIGVAVNAMDRDSQALWLKIISTPAKALRTGAVLSPEFMLRNPLRDTVVAFIQATHGALPVHSFYVGLKNIFKNSEHYQEWMINGGANANLVSMDRAILHTNPLTMGGVANKVVNPKQWYKMLQDLSELSENATRVGMYVRAREKGVHRLEAAYSAREGTLDFSRVGSSQAMRALNSMVPFLNVHLEGLDRAVRAAKADPVGFSAKAAAAITLPSVLLWFRNKDDERVQQLPAWQRDLFWIVTTNSWQPISTEGRNKMLDQMAQKIGNLDVSKLTNTFRKTADGKWEYNAGTIYRVPKPFELGVIFGSVPERLLDAYFKENPKAFNGLSKTVERALVPNYIPQAVLPFMEQWANRSLFLDRNLLTEQQTKLPPAQQFGPHTSETAKAMGTLVRGIAGDKSSFGSPIIIDNYIRQWTGGLGKHVTDIIDAGIKSTKDTPPGPTSTPADWPGYKAFAARFPDRGAQAIQDFYDLRNSRKTEQAGIKELSKTDKEGARTKSREANADVGDSVAKQLKADRDAVIKITNDKNMSPDDKRAAIDLTYLLMIEHAKKGLSGMERVRRKAP